jgi:hypothetical protein
MRRENEECEADRTVLFQAGESAERRQGAQATTLGTVLVEEAEMTVAERLGSVHVHIVVWKTMHKEGKRTKFPTLFSWVTRAKVASAKVWMSTLV